MISSQSSKRYPAFGESDKIWYVRNGARVAAKEVRLAMVKRPQALNRPIMTFYEPRSGSTWLMEMLARINSLVVSQDPLIERNGFAYARFYKFQLRPIYYDESEIEDVKLYLDDVFALKRGPDIDFRSSGIDSQVRTPVIGSPNSPWVSNWFQRNYNPHILFLIRHPLAVVRSQMRFLRTRQLAWHSLKHPTVKSHLTERAYAALNKAVVSQDEFHMRLAQLFVRYIPLIENWDTNGIVTSYEHLVAKDFSSLSFLEEYDSDWEKKIQIGLNQPSRSTRPNTEGAGRVGKSQVFKDEELAMLSELSEDFGAENFMKSWGYL